MDGSSNVKVRYRTMLNVMTRWKSVKTLLAVMLVLACIPSGVRAEKLGIGIVTSYFGSHPQLQKFASDAAIAIAHQNPADTSVDIIPFEVKPGVTITTAVSDMESKIPQVPMSQKSSGHDNERAIRFLASRYKRFVLISNGPSVGATGVLSGGGLPKGTWTQVIPVAGSSSNLHIWGSPTVDEQSVVTLIQQQSPKYTSAIPSKVNRLSERSSFGNQNLVLAAVALVSVLVLAATVTFIMVLRRSSREISAKIERINPSYQNIQSQSPTPGEADNGTKEGSVSEHAAKFESLVGDLGTAVMQIQTERFDETVSMRQSLANVRADIRKFDETVLSYGELLYRMSSDELNEASIRTNCTYLLGRLKRYFERSGLDLIIPTIGDEVLEELHSIVATRPATSEYGHMAIVDVQNIGIRRGQEVYVRAKVEVTVEDSK
jgi:hypothetical protein